MDQNNYPNYFIVCHQVNGGPLEQLGSNVSITGSVETLRVDIIESEASKLNRKKRKTGLHPGNTDDNSPGDTCDAEGRYRVLVRVVWTLACLPPSPAQTATFWLLSAATVPQKTASCSLPPPVSLRLCQL